MRQCAGASGTCPFPVSAFHCPPNASARRELATRATLAPTTTTTPAMASYDEWNRVDDDDDDELQDGAVSRAVCRTAAYY